MAGPIHVQVHNEVHSRSKGNDTLGEVHRRVYTGICTRQGDCCVANLPKRKREGTSEANVSLPRMCRIMGSLPGFHCRRSSASTNFA